MYGRLLNISPWLSQKLKLQGIVYQWDDKERVKGTIGYNNVVGEGGEGGKIGNIG